MKTGIAALAGFAPPAIVALYVALAPLGGALAPLDAAAAQLAAVAGPAVAVLTLLGLGAVLALVAAVVARRGGRRPPRIAPMQAEAPELVPAWTPPAPAEPSAEARADARADDRISGLRRRALPDAESFPETSPAPEPEPAPEPAPAPAVAPAATVPAAAVILIRKPRERGRDWFGDSSWFGGLPRLGGASWPRDAAGTPLPFAAQIDLVELAVACPDTPLPRTGSLAFFLGTGAVVPVPEGTHDFTDPPRDLPPAFDEGGAPFPATAGRLTRWFFPFWPVAPVALELPRHLREHRETMREAAIEEAMAVRLQRHAPLRDHPFYAAGVGAPVEALWWHSVIHLADQLHEALDACARPLAVHRAALDDKRAAFERLRLDPHADPEALEHAAEAADYLADELDMMEAQSAALPEMVEALDNFVDGRDPWAQLTPEERDMVADILAEVHERFGELVRFHAPGSLAQLATLSLRAMISGPPETLPALPDAVLARINRDYRLPPVDQHQMFGLPAGQGPARKAHRSDLLLLQLGYDDMMEWGWSDAGRYQFWIDEADAVAGNWHAATLTFESE
ncbi:DUF1963 domain-containing protein [Novosphingobium sp. BL-52-GroH]|uniref:DUF1963 domain-containing protein n=1 Tax=Novosphingobium sp. BL-52-GroH TaxID=3349877 RepID=UPI00384BC4A5